MIRRLLVVDDEPTTLLAFRKLFGNSEIAVDTAETMEKAIAMIDGESYCAAIVDLRLTGILSEEGLEILQYAKTRQPDMGVIMITGCGNDDAREKATRLGADYYFEKPVSPFVLREALKELGVNYDDHKRVNKVGGDSK